MDGIAADDAAERDGAVIGPAPALRRIGGNRDRGRDFERARHADAVELAPRLLQRFRRAGKERVGNIVVIARLDDENARTLGAPSSRLPRRGPAIATLHVRAWS